MLRGEIRLVDLDPARGEEANRYRPAIVVSNDRANAAVARLTRGIVTVVPVSGSVARVYPFQVLLPAVVTGLRVDAKAHAEQLRSVAAERVGRVIGRVRPKELTQLDDAIRLHLQL